MRLPISPRSSKFDVVLNVVVVVVVDVNVVVNVDVVAVVVDDGDDDVNDYDYDDDDDYDYDYDDDDDVVRPRDGGALAQRTRRLGRYAHKNAIPIAFQPRLRAMGTATRRCGTFA